MPGLFRIPGPGDVSRHVKTAHAALPPTSQTERICGIFKVREGGFRAAEPQGIIRRKL